MRRKTISESRLGWFSASAPGKSARSCCASTSSAELEKSEMRYRPIRRNMLCCLNKEEDAHLHLQHRRPDAHWDFSCSDGPVGPANTGGRREVYPDRNRSLQNRPGQARNAGRGIAEQEGV